MNPRPDPRPDPRASPLAGPLTRAEIEEIAASAATKAVRETLLTIGVDVSHPIEAQRDFAVMRQIGRLAMDAEFRKDLEYAREWRLGMQSLRTASARTAIGVIVTATLGALWLGIQQLMARGH